MKKIINICLLLVLIASFPAYADSIVRVQCEEEDTGTEIYIDGKFVGECPVDAPVKAGTAQLRARKTVQEDYEKIFEKKLRVIDGVAQRVEIVLSAPQMTSEARLKKETAEANALLGAAEAGDIDAMKGLAQRYDGGIGVKKDPSIAASWRHKAETTTAAEQLRAAEAGDIEAMKNMAYLYDAGIGVKRDPSQAQAWREKTDVAKREKIAREEIAKREEKALNKQRRVDSVDFFPETKSRLREAGDNPISITITGLPNMVTGAVSDIITAPFKSTELYNIRTEAALRPSTWGKPDSMIARATQQQKAKNAVTENSLLFAAAK